MPSSRPLPARRIEAKTSFLPLMVGDFILVIGVSIGDHFELEIARHLVAHQVGDLAQQPAEAGDRGLLVAHDRQLVLDQRVIDDGDVCHAHWACDAALDGLHSEEGLRPCVPGARPSQWAMLSPISAKVGRNANRSLPRGLGKSSRIGHLLAGVIGAAPGRIVAVVGGEDQQIVVAAAWRSVRAGARSKASSACGIAGDVAAVAVFLVEIDEIGHDEGAVGGHFHGFEGAVEQHHVARRLDLVGDAVAGIDVGNLADGDRPAGRRP